MKVGCYKKQTNQITLFLAFSPNTICVL